VLKVLIALELFSLSLLLVDAHTVTCEKIAKNNLWEKGERKTGFMDLTTEITAEGFTIAGLKDEDLKTLTFATNKKIMYLPDSPVEVYPNLELYGVGHCSVLKISCKNFRGLKKLKFLDLNKNNIEVVSSNTFKGLKSLEIVWMCMNEVLHYGHINI
jgi:maleate cis-trans isomerase